MNTIEAAFVLVDNATGTLRDIRSELRGVRDDAIEAGIAMDALGTKDPRTHAGPTTTGTIREDVTRTRSELQGLDQDIGGLNRQTIRPKVDRSGIDLAQRDLADFKRALEDAETRSAITASRIRSNLAGAGGGGGATSIAGGGAGGRGGLASALGGLPWWAGLLPFAPGLAGGATALVGSAGGAALGAGALGVSGLSAGVFGGGLPLALSLRTQLPDITKMAQQDAQLAAARQAASSGPYSGLNPAQIAAQESQLRASAAQGDPTAMRQLQDLQNARAAQQRVQTLQRQITQAQAGSSPQQVQAAQAIGGFQEWWQGQAGRISAPIVGALPGLVGNVQGAVGQVTPSWTTSMGSVAGAASNFSQFLGAPPQINAALAMSQGFQQNIPIITHEFEDLLGIIENIAQDALPFFTTADQATSRWMDHLLTASDNTARVDEKLSKMVKSGEDWVHLGGALGHTLSDLLQAGQPSGDSLVVSMTRTLDHWDAWLKANPDKVRNFFHESATTTRELARAIAEIAGGLGHILPVLMPVVNEFGKLANLGIPGLLLPGLLRYGLGQVFPGSAASGGMIATMLGRGGGTPGGGAAAGLAGQGDAQALARASNLEAARGQTSSGAFLMGPATGWDAETVLWQRRMAQRAATAEESSIMAALRGAQGAAGRGIAGAMGRVPIGPSPAAEEVSAMLGMGASGMLGAGRSLLGGAARFLGPMAIFGGLLGAAGGTGGGGVQGLWRNVASGATFGLIPNQGQVAQQTLTGASRNTYDQLTGARPFNFPSFTLGSPFTARELSQMPFTPGGLPPSATTYSYMAHPHGAEQTGADVTWLEQAIPAAERQLLGAGGDRKSALTGDIQAMKQRLQELKASLDPQIQDLAKSEGDAFQTYSKRFGLQKAFQLTNQDVVGRLRALGPEGAKEFADNQLEWARSIAQQNPKLKGLYYQLQTDIVGQFRSMGQQIAIINGQIYDVSSKAWNQISAAISGPAEQARVRAGQAFDELLQQAVDVLVGMGFNKAQATNLVKAATGAQGKTAQGAASAGVAAAQHPGFASTLGTIAGAGVASGAFSTPPTHARGGRLPGVGLQDTVPTADGGFGAPGELLLNRHTEADIDADLISAGKRRASERVAGEYRAHSAQMSPEAILISAMTGRRFALGGALSSAGATTTGTGAGASGGYVFPFPQGAAVHWERVDQGQDIAGPAGGYVLAIGPGNVSVASPNPGGFGSHYPLLTLTSGPLMGKTVYYGHTKVAHTGATQAGQVISQTGYGRGDTDWQGNASGIPGHLEIGFWPPGSMSSGGAMAQLMHSLASHQAIGGLAGGALGALGAAAPQMKPLKAPNVGLGGIPGAMAQHVANVWAAGLTQQVNKKLGAIGAPGAPVGSISGNIMQIAQQAAAAEGVPFDAAIVSMLLQKESSGGQNLPANGPLGATGPFQVIPSTFAAYALPGHGNIHNPVDNALAAFHYIKSRYGTLQGLASSTGLMGGGYHGYSTGGRLDWGGWNAQGVDTVIDRPTLFGAGEAGRERVTIAPDRGNATHGRIVRGPLIHAPITINGAHDAKHVETVVERKLEKFAELVAYEIEHGTEVHGDAALVGA